MLNINARVRLSQSFAQSLGLDADGYGLGYVSEVAESTGVLSPVGTALYAVTWYRQDSGKRHIFREGELVEDDGYGQHGFDPVDAALDFMRQYDDDRPAFQDDREGE